MQGAVIVTGSTGNLGAAVCRVLAGAGRQLVCVDHGEERIVGMLAGLPPDAEVLPLTGIDLADEASARSMVEAAVDRFGAVSGLVNTVGGFGSGRVADEGSLDRFDRMMRINARAAMAASAAVLPAMVAAGGGRIVHVAAQSAIRAPAGQAAYAGSKAAVIRLVESIAAEHRKDGITANCVLPTTIDTPENRAAMPNADTSAWVPPEAIARLIAFLVSPEGGVVTGAAVPANGFG